MSIGGLAAPRSRWRRLWWLAAALVLVLLAAAAWVGWKGSAAYAGLSDAQAAAAKARSAVGKGDAAEATRQLTHVTESLGRARDATSDPLWRAASELPWLGPNLQAVTALTVSLDQLAGEGVAPVVDAVTVVASGGLAPRGGRIDLAPLQDAAPGLARAADAGEAAAAHLHQIDPQALLPLVAERVEGVREEVDAVASALRTGARAAELLPGMLGADGERRYLALFLNSAELRSTGGLVGAMSVITVDDGALSMSDTRAGTDLPRLDRPVLPLTRAERALHGEALGRTVQGLALTPDFARTARLAAAMWQADTGERVDGVIATDVVALAKILEGTGPVTTRNGTELTSENVVAELLHEPYLRYRRASRADAFFADAAGRVFDRIVSGKGSFTAVVDGLAAASGEGRVLVWSRDSEEQEALHTAGLSGAFLSGAAPRAGGIFLNDATGGKLDYFLDTQVGIASVVCEEDGMRVVARLRLASRVPEEVSRYPRYVTGLLDLPKGTFMTRLTAYGPEGGKLLAVRQDGAAVGGTQAEEGGRDANVISMTLAPGEAVTYEIEWRVPSLGPVEVWATPTTTSTGRLWAPGSCVSD